jgi:hypothetical protein
MMSGEYLESFPDRLPYIEHWSAQADGVEALPSTLSYKGFVVGTAAKPREPAQNFLIRSELFGSAPNFSGRAGAFQVRPEFFRSERGFSDPA